MKHLNSSALLTYWEQLRGSAKAPERQAIDPKGIARLLPDIFILDTSGSPARFRLAGTRACAAHMRELKGTPFNDLWCEEDRRQIETVIEAVGREKIGAVIGSRASTEMEEISFETLLLPLMDHGDSRLRLIGIISALKPSWSLGSHPVGHHSIASMRMLVEGATPSSAMQAAGLSDGGETPVIEFSRRGRVPEGIACRKVGHLLVIEGGV